MQKDMAKVLREGDIVQLIDTKRRTYQLTLKRGETYSFLKGMVSHDDMIGREEGCYVRSSMGERLLVIRPTLSEYILKMPRGAQVIYPKDIGAIITMADIARGVRVLEAGTGSGALTAALSRAVGDEGCVVSYERRADFSERARSNLAAFFGRVPENVILREGDVYETLHEDDVHFDRVVLDLAEPWRAIDNAKAVLSGGGIVLAYLPTVLQVYTLCRALERKGGFYLQDVAEVLVRGWHVAGRSIRPEHRMVAHTGFLVMARRLSE